MRKNLIILIMLVIIIMPALSLAAVTLESGIPGVKNPGDTASYTPDAYINLVYKFVLGFVGIAGFLSLVWYGVVWISSGIADRKNEALDGIKNTLIGIGLAFTSYLILYAINPQLTVLRTPDVLPQAGQNNVIQDSSSINLTANKIDGYYYYTYIYCKDCTDNSQATRLSQGYSSLDECTTARQNDITYAANNPYQYLSDFSNCEKYGNKVIENWQIQFAYLQVSASGFSTKDQCVTAMNVNVGSAAYKDGCSQSNTDNLWYYKFANTLQTQQFKDSNYTKCETGRLALSGAGAYTTPCTQF